MRNMIIAKFTTDTPLYKIDQFVNKFRDKKNKVFIDVKLSHKEHIVAISKPKNSILIDFCKGVVR